MEARGKLIRDKIPAIIEGEGKTCAWVSLSEQEYQQALGEKLKEEAAESAIALSGLGREELIGELADLYEVIDSILVLKGIDLAEVKRRQDEKREQRGGFSHRVWLRE